ncbi:MAG TPA: methyltransferase domain-containing protein [Solirubrobacteraceae bacterium]
MSEPALPPPAVPPSAYDDAYYREACAGAEAWTRSGGREIDPLYPWALRLAGLAAGETVLDVGCGRGELLVAAVEQGAARAIGVEYSPAAVALARATVAAHGADDRAEVLQADARRLPLPGASADLVTLLDVVEHLTPAELALALTEARRVLRPGGRVFVHTMPNRLIFTVTYRALRLATGLRWPADPRTEHERRMHVNEQTRGGLERALRAAGFADARAWYGRWVREDVPGARFARALARRPRSRALGAADVWAVATTPATRP